MKISILGGGGWGLALSKLLAENGHELKVWEFNPINYALLKQEHGNPLLLKGIQLPDTVSFTNTFEELADSPSQIILLATPSQFIRKTLQSIPSELFRRIFHYPELKAIVNVAKGIEENSLKTIDQILIEELPLEVQGKICALSGPSHAEEVARGLPTTVVIAGSDEELLIWLQDVFSNEYFRVYRSPDLIGVEIGGAIKNIIAIAAGIVAGLGYGDNTMGALLTRGIVEIGRFGAAMGALPETFMGLSGMGDLITTATSPHSRNRYVGYEIGSGKKLNEIIKGMNMVAEGVATTRSVHFLAKEIGVEMPIVDQVYQVLFEDKNPREAMRDLMLRDLKAE
ncbi:MAG: NAD(P)-dependent glycerol-3-phosphate dehydrogenase [Candidatus Cloacimonetes bacterium]|nr:NAD(P)-dependent glycerol-3-phosphate dehydrogenase [Candidatus Cloacimonadota bacterium]MDD2543731.1 NAD(P)-dependent glycerol-3-phosphate dehydrogenase [Candidatus Cloacimonadota bacterium]MDD4666393.1 NAD(P)-dependent glycerol-3-phosphate dehydrogenase [Candidatus Cloacimonadota bacterium]